MHTLKRVWNHMSSELIFDKLLWVGRGTRSSTQSSKPCEIFSKHIAHDQMIYDLKDISKSYFTLSANSHPDGTVLKNKRFNISRTKLKFNISWLFHEMKNS